MFPLKRLTALLLALLMAFSLFSCGADLPGEAPIDSYSPTPSQSAPATEESFPQPTQEPGDEPFSPPVDIDSYYYDIEGVVLYLYYYGQLPPNYITKDEARDLGWEGGSVERFLEGAAIGGDRFGNREGLLPKADDRTYTECDLYTNGADSRGAERLVFSNDGLYFYTDDHYETFYELIVTEDGVVEWK